MEELHGTFVCGIMCIVDVKYLHALANNNFIYSIKQKSSSKCKLNELNRFLRTEQQSQSDVARICC